MADIPVVPEVPENNEENDVNSILFEDVTVNRPEIYNEMRNNEQLIDCIIRIGEESISAHRLILSAISPFFFRLFMNNIDEIEHTLGGEEVHENILADIVEFAYIGRIEITSDNAFDICRASHFLCIQTLTDKSELFLCSNIHPDNIIKLLLFAKQRLLRSLLFSSTKALIDNYDYLLENRRFAELSYENLTLILEELQTKPIRQAMRQSLCHVIIDFVKQDANHNILRLNDLLNLLPLTNLSRNFLQSIFENEDVISKSIECIQNLREAQKIRAHETVFDEFVYVYYLTGTNIKEQSDKIMRLNFFNKIWEEVPVLAETCDNADAVVYNNRIYVFGGECNGTKLSKVRCFDPQSNVWTDCAPLPEAVSGCAVTVYGDEIVIAGGRTGAATSLTSVHLYSPTNNTYRTIASLRQPRHDFRLVVLDNQIYAIGGNEKTAEKYVENAGEWFDIPEMNYTYHRPGVVAYDNRIYVSGNGQTEVFILEFNVWNVIQTWNHSRKSTCLLTISDKLFSIGGESTYGNIPLNNVFMFDPISETWSYFIDMLDSRTNHCAVIVRIEPNPDPAPEQVPDPAPEQIPDPAPEQIPDPAPEQVPDPAPEQVPDPAPGPI